MNFPTMFSGQLTLTKCIQQLSHDTDIICLRTKSIGPDTNAAAHHIVQTCALTNCNCKPVSPTLVLVVISPSCMCEMSLIAHTPSWILATGTKTGCGMLRFNQTTAVFPEIFSRHSSCQCIRMHVGVASKNVMLSAIPDKQPKKVDRQWSTPTATGRLHKLKSNQAMSA